jgi:hypothetical protein
MNVEYIEEYFNIIMGGLLMQTWDTKQYELQRFHSKWGPLAFSTIPPMKLFGETPINLMKTLPLLK